MLHCKLLGKCDQNEIHHQWLLLHFSFFLLSQFVENYSLLGKNDLYKFDQIVLQNEYVLNGKGVYFQNQYHESKQHHD